MEINKILDADILDIIFDGRNKQYGAYDLRKTYNKRLLIALVSMLGVCLLIVVGSLIAGSSHETKKAVLMVQDVDLASVKEEKKEPPPPPPPPPPKEPPKVEIKQFTPPKIVKEEVKEPPPKQEELEDTKIGTINQEGIKADVVAPPVETGTGVVAPPKVEEDYDKEFKTVQIMAQFPGGPEAWQKYLQRNLRAEVPTDNGASPGNYTVVVSFLVDKEGNISEVKAENDPGFGTADEAVRVIQRGPKWKAAVQNGRQVIYRQKQSITFQVAEG